MSNNSDGWMIWVGVLAIAALGALFGSSGSSSNTTAPTSVDRGSPEYRYAKERVKLEGYSDREAQQAADAIIKFHNAQQNR